MLAARSRVPVRGAMFVKVGDSTVDVRVECLLSMPRLAFTANAFSWIQALMPLGIRPTMGTGAFWEQVQTRNAETFINTCEYLLFLDYDSFICQADVEQLIALAMVHQCDAIAPIQTKREDGRPILTPLGTFDSPTARNVSSVDLSWFTPPVQEVDGAHFGCTVISTAALKRARLPWFHAMPGPDGRWNEDRVDADMSFWKNWRESGNRVFVTPRVCIGHGEYVIAWPSKDFSKPVYQYCSRFTEGHTKPQDAWSGIA